MESAPGVGVVYLWESSSVTPTPCNLQNAQNEHSTVPISVAAGKGFFLYLTDLGKLYSWGRCSYGKLGHGKYLKDCTEPTLIEALQAKRIIMMACGDHHALALDESGNVFSWGNASYGRLGYSVQGEGYSPLPYLVEHLKRKKIIQVAAGADHSLALSAEGEVFAWGSNAFGKLGVGDGTDTTQPQQVKFGTEDDGYQDAKVVIKQIGGGWSHSVALDVTGKVWTWGLGNDGRLGHGAPTKGSGTQATRPKLVAALQDKPCKAVIAGGQFTLAVTEHDELYAWGNNTVGQLGLGHFENQFYPTRVTALPPTGLVEVTAGLNHTVVLTADGEVWFWGSRLNTPVAIKFEQLATGIPISKVAAGGEHTIAVTGFLKSILGEEMKQAFLSDYPTPHFADIKFVLDDGSFMCAHKSVLEIRAPKFMKFVSQIGEPEGSSDGTQITVVRYVGVKSKVMNLFLLYVYTDALASDFSVSQDMLEELGNLADKFDMIRLAVFCGKNENSKVRSKNEKAKFQPSMIRSTLSDDFERLFFACNGAFENTLQETTTHTEDPSAQQQCDVIFVVEDTKFYAHKVLLCARSKYFSTMFKGNMKEASMKEIQLDSLEPETFYTLLKYLYTDKIETSPTTAIDLLSLANEYNMPRLKLICEGIIEKGVDVDTVAYVYKAAVLYEAKNLVQFCLEIIFDEWDAVSKTESFAEQLNIDERASLQVQHEEFTKQKKKSVASNSQTEPSKPQPEKPKIQSYPLPFDDNVDPPPTDRYHSANFDTDANNNNNNNQTKNHKKGRFWKRKNKKNKK